MITYAIENDLKVQEFKEVLINSTLGERRPIDSDEHLQKMLDHANLIVTARENGRLVGVGRSLSDFAFCTYMSDLAVDLNHQKKGIGKEIIRETKAASPDAKLILIAAPAAEAYYPKIGMDLREHCFTLDKIENLK